jgi:hypothetical protein
MEQNLQASLDQAAIDFSDPEAAESDQSMMVSVAHGDEPGAETDLGEDSENAQAQHGNNDADTANEDIQPEAHDDRSKSH